MTPDLNQATRYRSEWMDANACQAALQLIPHNAYPNFIEAKTHRNCCLQYRFELMEKNRPDCHCRFIIGAEEDAYLQQHSEFCEQGFELLQHQSVQLNGRHLHQAIWISNTY